MGNNFMRLLLESLVSWGTRFPTNSKKEPTRFRKTLIRLQDEKVVIPKELTYYSNNPRKTERNETPQGPSETPQGPSESRGGISNESISNAPSAPTVKPKDSKEKHCTDLTMQSRTSSSCTTRSTRCWASWRTTSQ